MVRVQVQYQTIFHFYKIYLQNRCNAQNVKRVVTVGWVIQPTKYFSDVLPRPRLQTVLVDALADFVGSIFQLG